MDLKQIKEYTFDLDKHQSERWINIFEDYKHEFKNIKDEINRLTHVSGFIKSPLNFFMMKYNS